MHIYHQEPATILLNYHIGRIVLGSMCVGVSAWLVWSGIKYGNSTEYIYINIRKTLST